MGKWVEFFESMVFPSGCKCLACGCELASFGKYQLCPKCLKSLPYITGKVCNKCGEQISHMGKYCKYCKGTHKEFEKNTSIFLYDGIIKQMIRNLKYDNALYLVPTLSNFMANAVVQLNYDIDYVVPVPLSATGMRKRGFNQSKELCNAMEKDLHMCVRTDILIKSKETINQASLNRVDRLGNLKDAFVCPLPNEVKGRNILLVDDVYTTGTTANECAKALTKAKANIVYVLTLAHAGKVVE